LLAQERRHVHVERQQIADGVCIGAVQALMQHEVPRWVPLHRD
jgi:hypothetical protein